MPSTEKSTEIDVLPIEMQIALWDFFSIFTKNKIVVKAKIDVMEIIKNRNNKEWEWFEEQYWRRIKFLENMSTSKEDFFELRDKTIEKMRKESSINVSDLELSHKAEMDLQREGYFSSAHYNKYSTLHTKRLETIKDNERLCEILKEQKDPIIHLIKKLIIENSVKWV